MWFFLTVQNKVITLYKCRKGRFSTTLDINPCLVVDHYDKCKQCCTWMNETHNSVPGTFILCSPQDSAGPVLWDVKRRKRPSRMLNKPTTDRLHFVHVSVNSWSCLQRWSDEKQHIQHSANINGNLWTRMQSKHVPWTQCKGGFCSLMS